MAGVRPAIKRIVVAYAWVCLLVGMLVLTACGLTSAATTPTVTPSATLPGMLPEVTNSVISISTPSAQPGVTPIGIATRPASDESISQLTTQTQIPFLDGTGMLLIKSGEFLMGSQEGDGEKDERPQHTVQLRSYWIDATEVTLRMYQSCVAAAACKPPERMNSYTREDYYANPDYLDYPVIFVDWFQASRYCQWVGKRLPTEAEWERAARGDDGQIYPWGNAAPTAEHANLNWLVGDTNRVGSYPAGASPYGALDMAGNVSEWVADWYGDYTTSPYKTYNPTGPEAGSHRVARGGSYLFSAFLGRSAERYWVSPYYADDDLGFRCAKSDE